MFGSTKRKTFSFLKSPIFYGYIFCLYIFKYILYIFIYFIWLYISKDLLNLSLLLPILKILSPLIDNSIYVSDRTYYAFLYI